MAPGLNGRQTGTVPKNKPKSSGSQTHRLSSQEPFVQSSSLDWEPMSDSGSRNRSRNKCNPTHSETEGAEPLRFDLGRSRSSTMTSQNQNGEGCSQEGASNKVNLPDRRQVVSKLSQIQSYVQQTAALMNALKVSDSPAQRSQYEKLAVMLEDLKDSEAKLSGLLNNMVKRESRIDSLLTDLNEQQPCMENTESSRMQKFTRIINENYGPIMCVSNTGNNNVEDDEEELSRRSEESRRKLEALQKRKQDLLILQEKAKKQLQEAQAEQSRLVARATGLNQELASTKAMDLNVQQLSQRLKAVQQMYNTRNQINDSLADNRRTNRDEAEHPDEDQMEMSETETDFQLVADKMEELNAMKTQLGQIQKLMASINGETPSRSRETGDEMTNHNSQNSSIVEGAQNGEDGSNNLMKLEQAKTKLNHLNQLLEIVQTAQNTTGLSPSYLQLVSNLVNEEAGSSTHSLSPAGSVKSPQRNRELSVETMQVMTRELEETTAAMKEERDRLLVARQELQDMARRLPLHKPEGDCFSIDNDSESEPPCLKPATLDSGNRDFFNGSDLTEAEQSPSKDDGSYLCRNHSTKVRPRGTWNASLSAPNSTTQERRFKNDSVSRNSNHSSRGGLQNLSREPSAWSPSPSVSYSNDRQNPAIQTQNQLEISGNLCEMMLSDNLQWGVRPGEISLQEMFSQHQLLTRTVAQCSQLLWLQQNQIIELRNALLLQCGMFPNPQSQVVTAQSQTNIPVISNPSLSGLSNGPLFSNPTVPAVVIQQQQQQPQQQPVQNHNSLNRNAKLNAEEIQNIQLPPQDYPYYMICQGNQPGFNFANPELMSHYMRYGNFNRFNPPNSNINQNTNQNVSSGTNNRVPNGMNCMGPEDSGALNNQVPPGNRANNYWDNFRSYSRQNLLSNTKSNEDTVTSRRSLAGSSQERLPRDVFVPPLPQNNQSGAGMSHPPGTSHHGNSESSLADQYLLPCSQNTRSNQHVQVTRSRSVEPQNHRSSGKNETRNQENECRNVNVVAVGKNEGSSGSRIRNSDCGNENYRSVRNDVGQSLRNVDNLNSSRNFAQSGRDSDGEELAQGNNKKRVERTRCRDESSGNLNNRGYQNATLWENIYSEVSNFVRANEPRPHFLIQLFRDLQQVTTDNLRDRTLESIQETVNANNLAERASNQNRQESGGNVNIIENRNNIRESRSNLNRNQAEDSARIDELFYHLRENQNTIRQNIGMSSFVLGGNNLENPNISNIRDLGNPRNNLESEGLRDLRTYFEANLCNFGHNSTLENPNLSNIRENLTRRGPGMSDFENVNPKNVYLSIYDNAAVEMRRRNLESSTVPDFASSFRNFEVNDYMSNEFPENSESIRSGNNQFEVDNNFETGGAAAAAVASVAGRTHFTQENRSPASRFPILDGGDNFSSSRQFLTNGNDSGIDINFNSDDRKRGFMEGEASADEVTPKTKKNEGVGDIEGASALILPQWERNRQRESAFDSSMNLSRSEAMSSYMPLCDNSFFSCRNFKQSDNGDLAEADQSRNEETSGAESDSGFMNAQIVEPEAGFPSDQSLQTSGNNFSCQNIPESERNFLESQNCESEDGTEGACRADPESNRGFPNSLSEPEGNFTKGTGCSENLRSDEASEGFYYQLNATTSSDLSTPKFGMKFRKSMEETAERETGESKKGSGKNLTNRFRDNSFGKFNSTNNDEYEEQNGNSESATSLADNRQRTESRVSLYDDAFQLVLDQGAKTEKENTSPETESDWECGSGLDQVPTRLKKSGSSKRSDDSGGSVP